MLEVETDQMDARGAEMIREEHRPISVREAAEIPEPSGWPGLRRRDGGTREPRGPFSHGRSVVAMAVNHRDRALGVRFRLIRHGPVKIGHEDRRKEAFLERDRGRLVRGEEEPASLPDLLRDVRPVSGHRDFLPSDDLPKDSVGNTIPAKELIELDRDGLVLFSPEAEIFQD